MIPTFERKSVTLEAAERMIETAKSEAARLNLRVTVAVCDESGIIKAISRMDGAPLLTVQSAQDKAYTAASFGIASDRWYEVIKDEPALLHGVVAAFQRLVIFGGGVPIKSGGELVGGLGVGGGTHHQDREIATKAVESIKT